MPVRRGMANARAPRAGTERYGSKPLAFQNGTGGITQGLAEVTVVIRPRALKWTLVQVHKRYLRTPSQDYNASPPNSIPGVHNAVCPCKGGGNYSSAGFAPFTAAAEGRRMNGHKASIGRQTQNMNLKSLA